MTHTHCKGERPQARTQADAVHVLEALRDFFAATEAEGLASAYARLAARGAAPPEPADWREAEYAFNRLFVGPGALIAPPYSSIYLDAEPRLQGQTTELVRAVHELLGVSPALANGPEDHLGVELDTALLLRARQKAEPANAHLALLRRYFVAGHMAAWVPKFADRVLRDPACPAVIGFAVRRLEQWLADETADTTPYEQMGQIPQPATGGHGA